MADNPFAPPQIDFAGNIANLLQDRNRQLVFQEQQQQYQKKLQTEAARKDALKGLMSGEDPKDSIKKLMSIGDIEGAQGLAEAYKTMQGPQMTPYEAARLPMEKADFELKKREAEDPKKYMTPEMRDYLLVHPEDPIFHRGQGTQDTTTPQPTSTQPGTTPTAPPDPGAGYAAFQAEKEEAKKKADVESKRPSYEDARARVNAIASTYTDTNRTINEILSLPDAVGSAAFGPGYSVFPSAGNIANARENLKTLSGQVGLSRFQQMRDTSKTGSAGMQRLTNYELQILGSSLGSLDPHQTWGQIKQHLRSVQQRMLNNHRDMYNTLEQDYKGNKGTGVSGEQTVTTPPPSEGVVPAAALPSDPRKWDDKQILSQAQNLARNQKMNKQQIIDWFKNRGVELPP